LLFLFVHAILETPMQFTTVWLKEQAEMSQVVIGLYKALEMAVSIVSLIILDRWLARSDHRRILAFAALGLFVLYPIWLFVPGIWPRFLLAIPISFMFTVTWPIGKAQSLAAVPGRGGTISAVQSLTSIVPLPLLFGLLAESISLTPAMFWVTVGGALTLFIITWFLPGNQAGEVRTPTS
jgi:fucose permease